MKKYILNYYLLFFLGVFTFTGCTSTFDEVNTDPDRPSEEIVPSTNILAYALRYASDNMFDEWFDLNESCGFAGQVSKLSYPEEGYYLFRPTVNNSSWSIAYAITSNLQSIINKSEVENTPNMKAVAQIFQAQIFQIITDRWRDAPYTEACKFSEGIIQPKYDKQEDIYPALLKTLKAAADALDEDGDEIGAGDALFKGSIVAWKRYCNSLRLRLAVRIAKVSPAIAKSTVEEIMGNPAKYPIIETNAQSAMFMWGKEYPEPWADYYRSRPNEYGISELMVNTLKAYNDPRLAVYAEPTPKSVEAGGKEYIGYPNGLEAYASVSEVSKIGPRFMQNLSGFTPWFRACESYFYIAEAAKQGFNVGMTAEAAYTKAVTLSLQENEIADAEITTYLAGFAQYDGSDEQLYNQLWIALFKQGMEAWTTFRRSGYPAGNRIAPDSHYPGHNTPPFCYSYPDTESNLNKANCAEASASIVDYFWGRQCYWDTRTNVH